MSPAQPTERKSPGAPVLLVALGIAVLLAAQIAFAYVNGSLNRLAFQSTATVDMAGYQRTLTQRMLAQALLLQRYEREGQAVISPHAELRAAEHVFDSTLRAFTQGGATEDSAGDRVTVDALKAPGEVAILHDVSVRWSALQPKLDALGDVTPTPDSVDAAADAAVATAPQLSLLMNDLSEEVEKTAARQIAHLSEARDALVGLTILGLLGVIAGFYLHVLEGQRDTKRFADDLQERNSELAASAAALAAAKARQDHIMETVRQGLFLIDSRFIIQDEYSKELEKILQTTELAGRNLLDDILRRLLSEKMYKTSRDYLGLLFDTSKRERTVLDVNPLEEIEVNFPDPKGGFMSRYLSFSFKRIVENRRITRTFIAVADVTDRVRIERDQREAERRKQRQFEMLLSVLHVEPGMLGEFLTTASEQVRDMNDSLRAIVVASRTNQDDSALRVRLERVFRCVHNIKGNAALLRIDYFQRAAEQFEGKLAELRGRTFLSGDDFLSVALLQSELRADLEELQELLRRLASVRPGKGPTTVIHKGSLAGVAGAKVPAETDPLIASLESLTVDLGRRLGKEVRLDAAGFDMRELDPEQRRLLKDVLIQLVRNSIAHGIERPEVRVAAGKPALGAVLLRKQAPMAGRFAFSFRDDGRGIDVDALRHEAVMKGMLTPETAASMDEASIAGLIFSPGFSTSATANEIAGRGVGMEVVKEVIVGQLKGEIGLSSEPGEFLELSFSIPLVTSVV